MQREPADPSGRPPEVAPHDDQPADHKQDLRRRLLATRAARPTADRTEAATANAGHLLDLQLPPLVVCGYLPLPSEPLATDVLDALLARGHTVLVPVVRAGAALDWCRYPTPTAAGPFGILAPTGPRYGPEAVRTAQLIMVPALAVDRAGHRLGRGGGHYDRTLALLTDESAPPLLLAVLFDGELVDHVPTEFHDVPVDAALTPAGGGHPADRPLGQPIERAAQPVIGRPSGCPSR